MNIKSPLTPPDPCCVYHQVELAVDGSCFRCVRDDRSNLMLMTAGAVISITLFAVAWRLFF